MGFAGRTHYCKLERRAEGSQKTRRSKVESTRGRFCCAREGSPLLLGSVVCENNVAPARADGSRAPMPLTSQSNSPGDACAIHVHPA